MCGHSLDPYEFQISPCKGENIAGAQFGDKITIKSTVKKESPYRLIFKQDAFLDQDLLVQAEIQLACVDRHKHLTALPAAVLAELSSKVYYLSF